MAKLQQPFNTFLDYFFHLPTLFAVAMVGLVMMWQLYDVKLEFGDGFTRFNSNQGQINIYWHNGCCQIDW